MPEFNCQISVRLALTGLRAIPLQLAALVAYPRAPRNTLLAASPPTDHPIDACRLRPSDNWAGDTAAERAICSVPEIDSRAPPEGRSSRTSAAGHYSSGLDSSSHYNR
jgi:hypothetical protein